MLELQDLKDFSIHNWYPMFKNVAMKTILIEIPTPLLLKLQTGDFDVDLQQLCSLDYIERLTNTINSLNKCAFVKNNWHAPVDAKMFSLANLLKVTNLSDLMLHLSASNIITSDFSLNCEIPYYIALKPWKSIHPASEFRCIVINNILMGITPRDWPTYYAHFKEDGQEIIEVLANFYCENISSKFPRERYTFDVIVSYPGHSVEIIDFGPLNSKSNLYAFTWKEVAPLLNKELNEEVKPVFRYLESNDMGMMQKGDALKKFLAAVI